MWMLQRPQTPVLRVFKTNNIVYNYRDIPVSNILYAKSLPFFASAQVDGYHISSATVFLRL